LTKPVLWRAGKSFVRLVGKLDTEAAETEFEEALTLGNRLHPSSKRTFRFMKKAAIACAGISVTLIVSQGDHRIDRRGPLGRNRDRRGRCRKHYAGSSKQTRRICRLYFVQKTAE
jgi:hypothetical protein